MGRLWGDSEGLSDDPHLTVLECLKGTPGMGLVCGQ